MAIHRSLMYTYTSVGYQTTCTHIYHMCPYSVRFHGVYRLINYYRLLQGRITVKLNP